MKTWLSGSDDALAANHDLLLSDLDGVIYRGAVGIDYAADAIAQARLQGVSVLFVTNNASREARIVAEHLSELGIPTDEKEVLTSAQAAASVLRARLGPGAKVLVVGASGLRAAVLAEGLELVTSAEEGPAAVVQGFGPDIGWRDLAEAAYAVEGGAWYVATNLDASLPTARGKAPGNGALVSTVVAATGVQPESCGKPEPTMYTAGVNRIGATRPLVVGDRLDTDIAGARTGGYPSLHVLTGVSTGRDVVLAPWSLRPDYLGKDLRALHMGHPVPSITSEGWWECGEAAARVRESRLELNGNPDIDLLRAACHAVWSWTDDGHPIDPTTVPDLGPW